MNIGPADGFESRLIAETAGSARVNPFVGTVGECTDRRTPAEGRPGGPTQDGTVLLADWIALEGMNLVVTIFALLTGLLAGALFSYLQVPIPAPPELPGVMGIIGIYVGYKIVEWADVGYDLLGALGVQ